MTTTAFANCQFEFNSNSVKLFTLFCNRGAWQRTKANLISSHNCSTIEWHTIKTIRLSYHHTGWTSRAEGGLETKLIFTALSELHKEPYFGSIRKDNLMLWLLAVFKIASPGLQQFGKSLQRSCTCTNLIFPCSPRASLFLQIFHVIRLQRLRSRCQLFSSYGFLLKIVLERMNYLVEFHDRFCRRPDWMTITVPVGLKIHESINIWIWYNLEACFHGSTWD